MACIEIRFDQWIRAVEEEREQRGLPPYRAEELEILYRDVGDPVKVPVDWIQEAQNRC